MQDPKKFNAGGQRHPLRDSSRPSRWNRISPLWSFGVRNVVLPLAFSLQLLAFPLASSADQPAWWATRGVLVTNAPSTNNYAGANLGQLKWFATNALAEFEVNLPGGAGANLRTNVATLLAATGSNFRVINIGMLKHAATPFYDRLLSSIYATNYPWADSFIHPNDFALVNLGQLKNVFAFSLFAKTIDSDGDGISDYDEVFVYGTNPNSVDTDGDGRIDGHSLVSTNLYAQLFPGRPWVDLNQDGFVDGELDAGTSPLLDDNISTNPNPTSDPPANLCFSIYTPLE